jgi:alginate O-acetyltransferase complex protein AlgI
VACDALFNNFCFLFAFLPIVLVGYWAVPSRRWKLVWLTAASYVFYAFWDVRFVLLLLFSSVVDYKIAQRIGASARPKPWLVLSIITNLSVLAFFKYAMFAAEAAQSVFTLVGVPVVVPGFHIILPVGISFYTFQTMSYTIDVYLREVEPTRDFAKYAGFVSLFPQLVAGPIVRYRTMANQLDHLPTRLPPLAAATGIVLFSIGLFKKVGVADTIARYIDPLWADPAALDAIAGWAATLGYGLQLYFDFSGYSDMAIGLGALLGLAIPVNFRGPYHARNPSDFWRRWHISLSTFLRDYLYIPLGGNRLGSKRRLANLLIVMTLGGLWHGAAWTFVLWGMYHGALLVVYQATRSVWDRAPVLAQRLLLVLLVMLGWVVFRAGDVGTAFAVYHSLLSPVEWGLLAVRGPLLVALGAVLAFSMLAKPTADMRFDLSLWRAVLAAVLFSMSILLLRSESSPFLYYQF